MPSFCVFIQYCAFIRECRVYEYVAMASLHFILDLWYWEGFVRVILVLEELSGPKGLALYLEKCNENKK